jgi:hypothetical protein
VAVAGVLAEADVGYEDESFGSRVLPQSSQTLLHDPVVIPCSSGLLVFFVWQPKQEESAYAQARCLFRFAYRLVNREIEDAGHRTYGATYAFARANKQRVDEVAGLKRGFADQRSHLLIAAQTAHAGYWETHGAIVIE